MPANCYNDQDKARSRESVTPRLGEQTTMAIETHCPTCLKTYTVADEQAGKTVRCKHCADMFTVSGTPVASRARDRDEDRVTAMIGVRLTHVPGRREGRRGRGRAHPAAIFPGWPCAFSAASPSCAS